MYLPLAWDMPSFSAYLIPEPSQFQLFIWMNSLLCNFRSSLNCHLLPSISSLAYRFCLAYGLFALGPSKLVTSLPSWGLIHTLFSLRTMPGKGTDCYGHNYDICSFGLFLQNYLLLWCLQSAWYTTKTEEEKEWQWTSGWEPSYERTTELQWALSFRFTLLPRAQCQWMVRTSISFFKIYFLNWRLYLV